MNGYLLLLPYFSVLLSAPLEKMPCFERYINTFDVGVACTESVDWLFASFRTPCLCRKWAEIELSLERLILRPS
jgi:hypothetical protein